MRLGFKDGEHFRHYLKEHSWLLFKELRVAAFCHAIRQVKLNVGSAMCLMRNPSFKIFTPGMTPKLLAETDELVAEPSRVSCIFTSNTSLLLWKITIEEGVGFETMQNFVMLLKVLEGGNIHAMHLRLVRGICLHFILIVVYFSVFERVTVEKQITEMVRNIIFLSDILERLSYV